MKTLSNGPGLSCSFRVSYEVLQPFAPEGQQALGSTKTKVLKWICDIHLAGSIAQVSVEINSTDEMKPFLLANTNFKLGPKNTYSSETIPKDTR